MSQLLKFARIRDDEEFKLRVGAAMLLHAQAIDDGDISTNSRSLVNWVLESPLRVPWPMLAEVISNGTVQNNVTLTDGVINSSAVPDDDIKYVVGATWEQVSKIMLNPKRGDNAIPIA